MRICPAPRLNLPAEVNDLEYHYKDIEDSISKIKDTLSVLTNDHILNEIQSPTSSVTTDVRDISSTLDYMESDYNNTSKVFGGVEETLQILHNVYDNYNLYIFVYIGLVIKGVLHAIQLVSLIVKAI